jgi:hypothetical protein
MMGTEDKSAGRKPFTAPELQVYGRARDITRTVANKSAVSDNGTKAAADKTS